MPVDTKEVECYKKILLPHTAVGLSRLGAPKTINRPLSPFIYPGQAHVTPACRTSGPAKPI